MTGRRDLQRALALLRALVDGLDSLKGQLDTNRRTLIAVRVVLAVPNLILPCLREIGEGTHSTTVHPALINLAQIG